MIAAVDGPVRAGGIGLMAACDLVVVESSITFAFTEVRIGVAPAIITAPILQRCSWSKLASPYLTGEVFDAATALDIGLVTHVTDDVSGTVGRAVSGPVAGRPERVGGDEATAAAATHHAGAASACRSRCSPATKAARAWPRSPRSGRRGGRSDDPP